MGFAQYSWPGQKWPKRIGNEAFCPLSFVGRISSDFTTEQDGDSKTCLKHTGNLVARLLRILLLSHSLCLSHHSFLLVCFIFINFLLVLSYFLLSERSSRSLVPPVFGFLPIFLSSFLSWPRLIQITLYIYIHGHNPVSTTPSVWYSGEEPWDGATVVGSSSPVNGKMILLVSHTFCLNKSFTQIMLRHPMSLDEQFCSGKR